jgi:hypothetical protein
MIKFEFGVMLVLAITKIIMRHQLSV